MLSFDIITSPIGSGLLRDLDGRKTGCVEDLIGEGRKPGIDDDDDAPTHSVLGVEGMTALHGHQNRHLSTAHFAFALYSYNPCTIYCCPYHRRLLLR
jgi:hypothetical protein